MTMTPEKAREMLAEMAEYQRIIAKCPTSKDFAKHCRVRAEVFECVLAHLAELEAQLADMRRDLSDARSGWEDAVDEVREMEAREATDCPHIRPYMAAVDDVESFDFWLSRASDAELRCAVALQRGEIDRLRLEPMRAAADTLRAMAEQHRIKNTCNGHWCASNAGEANRLLWAALLETADAMESKHESA